jgi:hypothetical protein
MRKTDTICPVHLRRKHSSASPDLRPGDWRFIGVHRRPSAAIWFFANPASALQANQTEIVAPREEFEV